MTDLIRMKRNAELVAGRRDGEHVNYERFKPEEWTGERAMNKPAESDLFMRVVGHEVGTAPKDFAADTLRLIEHVQETADNLTDLVRALPVHDVAGKVLRDELFAQISHLVDGLE